VEASSSDRTVAAKIGAASLHAQYDSVYLTTAARKAFLDRFEKEVDPFGQLDPEERARRATHAKRRYFLQLALRSAKARRKVKAGPK
jgi:hypothetical protein